MSDMKLKPCPMCGCHAEFNYGAPMNSGKRIVKVKCCIGCVEQNIFRCEEEDAAIAWNSRTQPEAPAPAQDLSAAILARQIIQDTNDTLREQSEGLKQLKAENDQLRAALASSANALSAGDRVDALPPDVVAWVEAETARIAAVHEYNAAIEAAKRFGWPGPDTNPQYQKMNTAGNVAHKLIHPAYQALAAILQSQKDNHG